MFHAHQGDCMWAWLPFKEALELSFPIIQNLRPQNQVFAQTPTARQHSLFSHCCSPDGVGKYESYLGTVFPPQYAWVVQKGVEVWPEPTFQTESEEERLGEPGACQTPTSVPRLYTGAPQTGQIESTWARHPSKEALELSLLGYREQSIPRVAVVQRSYVCRSEGMWARHPTKEPLELRFQSYREASIARVAVVNEISCPPG